MALTHLDPHVALVLIDLQNGIVALPTVHPADDVVAQGAQLASAFRANKLPVVLVSVVGAAPGRTDRDQPAGELPSGWTDLVPELQAGAEDLIVTKERWGAFQDTTLDTRLRELGVTQIVLGGIATSMGVESTARSGHELGYNVVVVTDATTDLDVDAHAHSISRVFPAIAETTTTADLLKRLSTPS